MIIFNNFFKINFLLIFLIILISCIGFAALYSAADGNFYPWSVRHLVRFSALFIFMLFIALIDIKLIYKYAYPFLLLCLILLLSVEVIGSLGKGAERWIKIFGISIQPSEIIKIGILLSLAKYYNNIKYENIGNIIYLFFPILIIGIPFVLTLLQPDLGTALTILILGIMVMFISGVKIWKFIVGSISVLILIPFLWNYIKPYQQKRILSFLNPENDPLGQGYQLIQSKIALGSGGFAGKGFLQGTQSYLEFLPEKQTDFIFTLIGEEFGFIGTIFVLILFSLIILICFYISFRSFHIFGRVLSLGIACNIFLYVLLNMSMVTGLMPVVGIPLPLISYGGTAMLAVMISFGLLLNIDINYNNKKLEK